MILDKSTGRSKGCALVHFEGTSVEAQRAMVAMQDSELKGRLLFIREDRVENLEGPRLHSQVRPQVRSGAQTQRAGINRNRQCFVGKLPTDVTWIQLKNHFSRALVLSYTINPPL